MKIIDFIVATIFTVCILYTANTRGYTKAYDKASEQPISPYFWIDNDRFLKDSQINPRPLYNELGDIIGSNIRVRNIKGDTFIEFLDSEKGAWKPNRDSWIVAFKVGCEDMTLEEALEVIR
jgi:hypothetical protein